MKPRKAEFAAAASAANQFPPADLPEVAIAGRSNVGKSSLINALVGKQGLARTSSTPGRTRALYWYRVAPQTGAGFALVDLPGYGYAKVSKSMRSAWRPLVEAFLARESVRAVVILVDVRRGAEDEERELLEYLDSVGIAAQLVLTKSDKLPKARRKPAQLALSRDLALARAPLLCSAKTGEGVPELWSFLSRAACDVLPDGRR